MPDIRHWKPHGVNVIPKSHPQVITEITPNSKQWESAHCTLIHISCPCCFSWELSHPVSCYCSRENSYYGLTTPSCPDYLKSEFSKVHESQWMGQGWDALFELGSKEGRIGFSCILIVVAFSHITSSRILMKCKALHTVCQSFEAEILHFWNSFIFQSIYSLLPESSSSQKETLPRLIWRRHSFFFLLFHLSPLLYSVTLTPTALNLFFLIKGLNKLLH